MKKVWKYIVGFFSFVGGIHGAKVLERLVDEGEAGVLVPKQNSIILAQEILRLIGDFELRVQLGKKSRKRYESMYTPRHYSVRIISAFNRIIQLDGQS